MNSKYLRRGCKQAKDIYPFPYLTIKTILEKSVRHEVALTYQHLTLQCKFSSTWLQTVPKDLSGLNKQQKRNPTQQNQNGKIIGNVMVQSTWFNIFIFRATFYPLTVTG